MSLSISRTDFADNLLNGVGAAAYLAVGAIVTNAVDTLLCGLAKRIFTAQRGSIFGKCLNTLIKATAIGVSITATGLLAPRFVVVSLTGRKVIESFAIGLAIAIAAHLSNPVKTDAMKNKTRVALATVCLSSMVSFAGSPILQLCGAAGAWGNIFYASSNPYTGSIIEVAKNNKKFG